MSKKIKTKTARKKAAGKGLVNYLIDHLPFEAHIPGGYAYAGPGTRLEERLKRGDKPKNLLDRHALQHDVIYSLTSDPKERNKADLILADKAWERVKSKDASIGERIAAYAVTNAMKLKAKLGMGLKKQEKQRKKQEKTSAENSARLAKFFNKSRKKTNTALKGNTRGAGMKYGITRVLPKKVKSKKIPSKGQGFYLRPYEPPKEI